MMFGILKEQHADCIVLTNGTRIAGAEGLERFSPGTRLAIAYSRDGAGGLVTESITRTTSK
jgi:hypothetical protein